MREITLILLFLSPKEAHWKSSASIVTAGGGLCHGSRAMGGGGGGLMTGLAANTGGDTLSADVLVMRE